MPLPNSSLSRRKAVENWRTANGYFGCRAPECPLTQQSPSGCSGALRASWRPMDEREVHRLTHAGSKSVTEA